jgi:hypothetical protein
MAARWPERIPEFMSDKTARLEDPRTIRLNALIGELLDVGMDEARLVEIADLIAEMSEEAEAAGDMELQEDALGDDAFIALMDSFASSAHPMVVRLQELMVERGWTGWSKIERASSVDRGR